jgi:hypothetical protein
MTYPISQGPWTVKQMVTSYLKADLPRRLVEFRNAWQMDDKSLPTPDAYYSHEPVGLDHWPSIITVQLSTSKMERIDYYGGLNPMYRCTYGMRTYVWARHEDPEGVTETRDRLTTVVRTALLDHPCLVKATSHIAHDIALDETTMREEFSDITYVKGDRAVAGAYIAYDVTLDEVVARANIADVEEISLGVDGAGNIQADLNDLVQNVVTKIIQT